MRWSDWRGHFEGTRARPLPGGLTRLDEVPERWRAVVAASLARFQLGEAGEGRIAHEVDGARLPGIDADWRAALKLFVAEEGRHARILGHMVRGLGGRLLVRNWTERLFVWGRRLLGLRLKLMVLLVAEVVGGGFYGLLASRLPSGPLRRGLEEVCGDERHHLRFHGDFFRAQGWGPLRRAAGWSLWWALVTAASFVVMVDHRRTLRALGIPLFEAAGVLFSLAREAARRSFGRGEPGYRDLHSRASPA